MASTLQQIGLKVRIVDARVFCFELLAVDVLKCLAHLVSTSDVMRRVVCASLSGQAHTVLAAFEDPAGAAAMDVDAPALPEASAKPAPSAAKSPARPPDGSDPPPKRHPSRRGDQSDAPAAPAELFMTYFTRLWKNARAEVRQVLLGSLLIEADFKRYLALVFSNNYETIFDEGEDDDQVRRQKKERKKEEEEEEEIREGGGGK